MKRVIRKVTTPDLIAKAVGDSATRLQEEGFPAEWARVGVVFEDQYIRIQRDPVEFPSGKLGTYIRIERAAASPCGVVVIPRMGDKLALVRHWRYALNSEALEFPRGFMNPGETAHDAAIREVLEEIGGISGAVELLGSIQPDSGLLNMPSSVFGMDISALGKPEIEEGVLETVLLTKAELVSRIASGAVTDGFTLSALTMASARNWF